MDTIPHPPRLTLRSLPPAVILPAIRDIPEYGGESIEEGPPVEVVETDDSERLALIERVGALTFKEPRVREIVEGRPYVFCGVSLREAKGAKTRTLVAVIHTYDDALTHEVMFVEDAMDLQLSDIATLDYQPAPTSEEIEKAIGLARAEPSIERLLDPSFEAQALLLSAVEPGDEHYGTRCFSVVFGPPDERLPHINAVVDIGAEKVLSMQHNAGGSR